MHGHQRKTGVGYPYMVEGIVVGVGPCACPWFLGSTRSLDIVSLAPMRRMGVLLSCVAGK
jgi:hypothetical protein